MDTLRIISSRPFPLFVRVFGLLGCMLTIDATAQIKPPGFEREVQAMEERKRTNVLDKDSVIVVDTITLFDPTNYEETMRIVNSNMSWRDYMMLRLQINQPDILLNGAPLKLTDPKTYETMIVQWNAGISKLDTIRQ